MTRLLLAVSIALAAAACGGGDGQSDDASRTVRVEMQDIAFSPAAVTVQQGETVRFVFTNTGKVAHDAFIGDEAAQADHEKDMGDGGHDHGGAKDAITVEPGETGELEHSFDDGGDVLIGCHQPGHYDAGMKVAVTVG